MSTTIKPLDIYIGGTKVFPDVNTGILAYSIYNDMYEDTQTLNSIHVSNCKNAYTWFENYTWNNPNILVMPIIEDTDDSPWHTNTNAPDNYWAFGALCGIGVKILDIPFLINQNWIADAIVAGTNEYEDAQFREINATVLNFDPNTSYPNTIGFDWYDDRTNKVLDLLHCRCLFRDCHNLKEIHGLNLGGQREHLMPVTDEYVYSERNEDGGWCYLDQMRSTFSMMFWECEKLTTLDITWPEALSGTNNPVLYGNVDHMFFGCKKLTDAQIPTFALRPINQGETIKMQQFFGTANSRGLISSLHITADSWPYIENARYAWAAANIQSIDIPATATNLSYIKEILGENLYTPTSGDYSGNKYIIRIEKPMADYLNDNDEEHVRLFNFGNYNDDSGFLSTFGGIYVPDNQLSDWQTYISNAGGSNIASNHVHGLSEL